MFSIKVDTDIELHVFQQRHAGELFWLVDSNREYLRTWLPWVNSMKSAEQSYSAINRWQQHFYENQGYNLAIRFRGILAGSISLHGIDWLNSQASIGYFITENMQGKGIMTRAAKAVLRLGFHKLALNRIEIRCGKENYRSQAIPVKLGFYKEGIIRDGEYLNGRYHDLIVFGLLSREWRQQEKRLFY